MIVQEHPPAQEAEVDFAEFQAVIAGVVLRLWMFCVRLSHSGKAFHYAYADGSDLAVGVELVGEVLDVPAVAQDDRGDTAVSEVLFGGPVVLPEGHRVGVSPQQAGVDDAADPDGLDGVGVVNRALAGDEAAADQQQPVDAGERCAQGLGLLVVGGADLHAGVRERVCLGRVTDDRDDVGRQ